jgi:hypothetical protein
MQRWMLVGGKRSLLTTPSLFSFFIRLDLFSNIPTISSASRQILFPFLKFPLKRPLTQGNNFRWIPVQNTTGDGGCSLVDRNVSQERLCR